MAKLLNCERETHINMSKESDKAQIYTSEPSVMHKLDKSVEESDDWQVVEIGRYKGEIVSKTYEAPRRLISFKKNIQYFSEERRAEAAERLRAWREKQKMENTENNSEDTGCPDAHMQDFVHDARLEPTHAPVPMQGYER